MAYTNNHAAAGNSVTTWIGGVVAKWIEIRQKRAVYLQTLNELSSMSDRDLADIAISRVSIRDIARKAAYGA